MSGSGQAGSGVGSASSSARQAGGGAGPARLVWWWVGVFVAAGVLYVGTLAPDVAWQDQGDYQVQAARLSLNRPGDVVRVHPLYIAAAHAAGRWGPFSPAYAANLVSAVFGAATVANVFLLVRLLGGRTWGAALGAAALGLSHSFWFVSAQAQTYTMALAALSGGLLLARGYAATGKGGYLLGAGLAWGLGLSVHLLTQVGFAAVLAWAGARAVRGRLGWGWVAGMAACWAAGAAWEWAAVGIEAQRTGEVWGALASAAVGRWGQAVFNVGRLGALLRRSVELFILNFPTPLVLLALPGLALSWRAARPRPMAGLLAICLALYAAFAVRYDVPNQDFFFLPAYLLTAVYVGLGFEYVFAGGYRRAAALAATGLLALLIPATYVLIRDVARGRGVELGTRRHVPYREAYTYYLLPWQGGQRGPRRFAQETLAAAPAGAVILADATTLPPLQYLQEVEGVRPDVCVRGAGETGSAGRPAGLEGRRVFTISDVEGYYPRWVRERSWLKPYPISAEEVIFEIAPPAGRERRSE